MIFPRHSTFEQTIKYWKELDHAERGNEDVRPVLVNKYGLTDKQATVIIGLYMDKKSLGQMARDEGVTLHAIQCRLKYALDKIKR